MLTVKIKQSGGGEHVVSASGNVTILRDGDDDFEAICRNASDSTARAILRFETAEYGSTTFLGEDDRAWIMNANGKTAAFFVSAFR